MATGLRPVGSGQKLIGFQLIVFVWVCCKRWSMSYSQMFVLHQGAALVLANWLICCLLESANTSMMINEKSRISVNLGCPSVVPRSSTSSGGGTSTAEHEMLQAVERIISKAQSASSQSQFCSGCLGLRSCVPPSARCPYLGRSLTWAKTLFGKHNDVEMSGRCLTEYLHSLTDERKNNRMDLVCVLFICSFEK